MIVENHAKGKIAWPTNQRVAVAITFDFQGGEPVRPGPNSISVFSCWRKFTRWIRSICISPLPGPVPRRP